jgi:transposase-like protein
MRRRLAVTRVLDKHRITCPRCRCPEGVVVIDATFNVGWQCIDCEFRWPASSEETTLLLGSSLKTIH